MAEKFSTVFKRFCSSLQLERIGLRFSNPLNKYTNESIKLFCCSSPCCHVTFYQGLLWVQSVLQSVTLCALRHPVPPMYCSVLYTLCIAVPCTPYVLQYLAHPVYCITLTVFFWKSSFSTAQEGKHNNVHSQMLDFEQWPLQRICQVYGIPLSYILATILNYRENWQNT